VREVRAGKNKVALDLTYRFRQTAVPQWSSEFAPRRGKEVSGATRIFAGYYGLASRHPRAL